MTALLLGVISVLLTVVGYIGKQMVDQLKSIASSVNSIKIELGVLTNDHSNLKEDVTEIKQRVLKLENAN